MLFSGAIQQQSRKRKSLGGALPGLFVPGRDCPKRMHRSEIETNPHWKQLDAGMIAAALALYDTDKLVQDAVKLKLNHILGGGIQFRRKFHAQRAAAQRWHSTVYTELLTQLYRSLQACGIAGWSIQPHPEYGGEPVLIDLSAVDVFILRDDWNRVTVKYFPKVSLTPIAHEDSTHEIENVRTTISSAPTADGQIRSIATVLQADATLEKQLEQLMVQACMLKANPPVVSEHFTEKNQDNPIYSAYGVGPPGGGGGASAREMQGHHQLAMYKQDCDARMRMRNGIAAPQVEMPFQPTQMMLYTNQVHLPTDRKVARVDAAAEPNRYIEFCQKRRDDVFAYFGIPPGVVAASGSGSSSRSNTVGTSANSMVVFVNDQKRLKNMFLGFVQEWYDASTRKERVLESIADGMHKRQRKSDAVVADEVETEIEMPGIPEDDLVFRMYMLGALSYDALCTCMAAKHGFSMRSFNKKPEVSVEDLNGIQPDVPALPAVKHSAK